MFKLFKPLTFIRQIRERREMQRQYLYLLSERQRMRAQLAFYVGLEMSIGIIEPMCCELRKVDRGQIRNQLMIEDRTVSQRVRKFEKIALHIEEKIEKVESEIVLCRLALGKMNISTARLIA